MNYKNPANISPLDIMGWGYDDEGLNYWTTATNNGNEDGLEYWRPYDPTDGPFTCECQDGFTMLGDGSCYDCKKLQDGCLYCDNSAGL